MNYLTFLPSPKLSRYVRSFWVLEGEASTAFPYVHRTMADNCTELIFHFKGRFNQIVNDSRKELSFTSGIHGHTRNYSRFEVKEDFGIFGTYMYPFAIPKLFSMPATEISDEMPDLASVSGMAGRELEEKIMLAKDHAERIVLLSSFLEKRLCRDRDEPPGILSAIQHVIHSNGYVNIDEMADRYFFSMRQFQRRFKEFSGFGPKLYARIARFQSASFEFKNQNSSLAEIAYKCGYYDQSHFIHEFKEFSGYHPRTYFSGNNESTLWMES